MRGRVKTAVTAFSPCMARCWRNICSPPGGPVEACWPPLTPEHGFPSLFFGPDAGRSPSVRSRLSRDAPFLPASFLIKEVAKNKAADTSPHAAANPSPMAPYGGITHIRLKGRSLRFLSAFRLPCFSPFIIQTGKSLSRGLHSETNWRMMRTTIGESAGARAERRPQDLDPGPDLDHANEGR